ncbi:Uncharacterised protein [uncultured archaeon]|nr:Uncharacterised protein [uncultured archaeon]
MFDKKTECTQTGTSEDGSKKFVCKTPDGNVYNATMGLDGNLKLENNFVTIKPEVYQKIHEALRVQSPV